MNKETERLKQRVRDKQEALERNRQMMKPNLNERMAEDTPDLISSYDFWCDVCEEDFTQAAYKTVSRIYGDPVVAYRTRHECGNDCIRLISHRDYDPYYQLSVKIRRQRNEYRIEALQAEDYGFATNYGNPYAKFEKELAEQEQKIIENERANGFRGLSLKAQQQLRGVWT